MTIRLFETVLNLALKPNDSKILIEEKNHGRTIYPERNLQLV
jgi:hypothetical protein